MPLKKAVQPSAQGVLLHLHVTPHSSQTLFPAGFDPWRNRVEIKVQAEAHHNKANNEIITTLAQFFHLQHHRVTLVSGQQNREKTVLLQGVSVDNVLKSLMVELDEH